MSVINTLKSGGYNSRFPIKTVGDMESWLAKGYGGRWTWFGNIGRVKAKQIDQAYDRFMADKRG